ncbi:MAG: nitrilase-related carbon-nitrogen hydrolase [Spirochaetota bacterium]
MSENSRVLCIPFVPVLGSRSRNLALLSDLAARIAAFDHKPDVVVLPELALSGYLLESLVGEVALVETELSEIANVLAASGMPAHTEWVIGLPLREAGEIYNCAVVFRGGEVCHIHRKLFLPTYGMFDESRYFARGTQLNSFDGVLGKTALLICEDAWHMELAFAVSAQKADAVIVISASPARGLTQAAEFTSSARWRHRLQTFAESYGQKYIYCNRGGVEDGVLFDGTSFVFDPLADYIAAEQSDAYDGAQLYRVNNSRGMRHGFLGNPARQNDVLLVQRLLAGA